MLLQAEASLEELVVQLLADTPGATAKQLEAALDRAGHPYSLRGIYKELGKLEQQGVVFKQDGAFNLHLAWIMKVLDFGDRAFEQYTTTPYLSEVLKGESLKRTERFTNLRKLDRLWTQLILALHKLYPKHEMCFWCPYQWFSLAQYANSKRFYEASDLAGYKRFHIIGDDSYLSRQALKDLPKNGRYSFATSPFDQESSTYYTVIADCILTVKLDSVITAQFAELFAHVRSERELGLADLERIFDARVKASLSVERSETKAARLKRKFSEFFGVEIA